MRTSPLLTLAALGTCAYLLNPSTGSASVPAGDMAGVSKARPALVELAGRHGGRGRGDDHGGDRGRHGGRGRGGHDDGPNHDRNDDHGGRGRGGHDDGPNHTSLGTDGSAVQVAAREAERGDDRGRGRNRGGHGRGGRDDGPNHDRGDDHGGRGGRGGHDDGPNHH